MKKYYLRGWINCFTRWMLVFEERYGGIRCSKCGYDRCFAALEYHHTIQDGQKIPALLRQLLPTEERIEQLESHGIWLCSNCHREEHCGCQYGEESTPSETELTTTPSKNWKRCILQRVARWRKRLKERESL